jgi:hypothetical protein
MPLKVAAALVSWAMAVGSCQGEPIRYGDIDVSNRTTVAIVVVAQSVAGQDPGQSLEVPPCGHAAQRHFAVGHFLVNTADGRTFAVLGGGGEDPNNAGPVFVLVTSEDVPTISAEAPTALPACTGAPPS